MYAHCFNTNCKWAASCSHAILFSKTTEQDKCIPTINPKLQTYAEDGKCQYYAEPVVFMVAHGMLKSTGKMPYEIYRRFATQAKERINKTDFYDMRSGKKPIIPHYQKILLRVAEDVGYEFPDSPWDSVTEEVSYL